MAGQGTCVLNDGGRAGFTGLVIPVEEADFLRAPSNRRPQINPNLAVSP